MITPMLLRTWILFCALTVALGWIASLFEGIAPLTYGVFFILFLVVALRLDAFSGLSFATAYRGFRRLTSWRLLLPGIFALSASLLVIKGLATAPSHGDGLSYRIPRVMHWIYHQQWYWIQAQDGRLNNRGTVSEWLTVPIMLFFGTDRLVFVPNWISYLFFPSLLFPIWRYLGVSSKIAWLAMWLVPSGFCFALQACNCSNDILATFYVLAAIYLVIKRELAPSWTDVALSCLCIALATGVKVSSMVYCLPWFVVVAPRIPILVKRPIATLAAFALGLLVSFFPSAVLNSLHGAGWTGLGLEPRFIAPPILVGLVCNSFLMVTQNLIPPLFTSTHTYDHISYFVGHSNIGVLIDHYFEPDSLFYYRQIPVEQAGLGFVVCGMMALLYCATSLKGRGAHFLKSIGEGWSMRGFLSLALWMAFLYSLAVANTNQPARLNCAFYPLLLPTLFAGRVFRFKWLWKAGKYLSGIAIFAGTCLILIFEVNPLIPLIKNLGWLQKADENMEMITVYAIPESEHSVGIIRYWNQREAWFWKPYGSREVMELAVKPDRQEIEENNIHYIFISQQMLAAEHTTIGPWTLRENAIKLGTVHGDLFSTWYLVKLNP
jgi:hypothetical protein